jgi:hypothetical protein
MIRVLLIIKTKCFALKIPELVKIQRRKIQDWISLQSNSLIMQMKNSNRSEKVFSEKNSGKYFLQGILPEIGQKKNPNHE